MARNYLYMFEFIVDDLLVTRPNECAPEEYPTCVELIFRNLVYTSICEENFGGCFDTRFKNGKCVLFALDKPVTEYDKLFIIVSKKKKPKCKFLIGSTAIPVKPLFDKVTKDFETENPYIEEEKKKRKLAQKQQKQKKDEKEAEKRNSLVNDSALDIPDELEQQEEYTRPEEFCITSEISKKLLAFFDRTGKQSGNIVLVMRLSCMGPNIISRFLTGKEDENTDICRSETKGKSPCKSTEEEKCTDKRKIKKNKKNICDKILGSAIRDDCICDEECEVECEGKLFLNY